MGITWNRTFHLNLGKISYCAGGTYYPKRQWSLSPWKSSKAAWTRPWETCFRSPSDPLLEQGLNQMSFRGTFQLQLVCESVIAKPLQQKLNVTVLQISPPHTLILTLPSHHLPYQALINLLWDIAQSLLHFNYPYFLCSVSSNYCLTELNRSQILYLTECSAPDFQTG